MHAHIGEPANVYMYMYTCMQTYTHKNRPTCIHIYIYTYIYYICMRTHTYIRTGPSIYIYISQKRPTTGPKETYYRPKYIYIYIYIYIYCTCMHTHKYTRTGQHRSTSCQLHRYHSTRTYTWHTGRISLYIQEPANVDGRHVRTTDIIRQGRWYKTKKVSAYYMYCVKSLYQVTTQLTFECK
jgi:hypothetical protein